MANERLPVYTKRPAAADDPRALALLSPGVAFLSSELVARAGEHIRMELRLLNLESGETAQATFTRIGERWECPERGLSVDHATMHAAISRALGATR